MRAILLGLSILCSALTLAPARAAEPSARRGPEPVARAGAGIPGSTSVETGSEGLFTVDM